MFGTIGKKDGNLEPWTLAGPAEGIVEKVGYSCDLDYPVSLTNGAPGIGYVGQSTACPITYNPNCLICCETDPDTGETIEIRKGVLRVDCIIADDMQGADCACYLYYNTANNNVNYEVPIWSNTDDANGYRSMYHSGGYPLEYNPITGMLSSQYMHASYTVCIGNSAILYDGVFINPNYFTFGRDEFCINYRGSQDCKWKFCRNGYMYGNTSGIHEGRIGVCGCNEVSLLGFTEYLNDHVNPAYTNGLTYCNTTHTLITDSFCGDYAIIDEEVITSCVRSGTCLELVQNNDDTCSCITLDAGVVTIYGCGGIALRASQLSLPPLCISGDVCIGGTLCACDSGMDVCDIRFCDGGYIYCNGEAYICQIRLCAPGTNTNVSWSTSQYVPTAACISNWLSNYGFVRTWRSGTTLYMCTAQA